TTTRPRAGTVTTGRDRLTQVPASSDLPPAASRSKPPVRGVNASLAYTLRLSGFVPALEISTWSLKTPPGVAPYAKEGRLSGPFFPVGRKPKVARPPPLESP